MVIVIILNVNVPEQITFAPRHFQLEGAGFKNTMKKIFKGSQKAWNSSLKPTINTPAPVISMAVGAESKDPQVEQVTTNILKIISGGKISSLIDTHGKEF